MLLSMNLEWTLQTLFKRRYRSLMADYYIVYLGTTLSVTIQMEVLIAD